MTPARLPTARWSAGSRTDTATEALRISPGGSSPRDRSRRRAPPAAAEDEQRGDVHGLAAFLDPQVTGVQRAQTVQRPGPDHEPHDNPGTHVTKVLQAGTSGANANRKPEGCWACWLVDGSYDHGSN
jgi:hypothetical protein